MVGANHKEKLAQETQRILDKHPGPLHRQLAEQLALDENPELAQEHEADDELLANQRKIKDWIAAAQKKNPRLSFRDAWSKCQDAHPGRGVHVSHLVANR